VSLADDPIGAYWNRPSALPLTDAGRKAIQGFDGASTDNPRLRCEPTNILFYQNIITRKVGQLRALGVEFVFGSDEGSFGMTAAQATWRELDAWVRHLDVDPMMAIRKATLDAARHLGVDRETGTVSEGKFADVIGVAGNPLQHIDVLRTPAVVVKHGRRYK
jgi:imidazolonepropionase-like amidohydrolase